MGGDEVSYGSRPKDAANWRSKLLAENPIDPARVHFLGKVPYATYKQVLQVSAVHLYLTYPFVLSWSLLEAMASGCLVVASDTAPVREVIEDGRNGRLVDFFDTGAIAERVVQALSEPERFQALRQQARATAAGYSTRAGIAGYLEALGLDLAAVGA